MNSILSRQEASSIRSKLWWVACNHTPFLIRMAVFSKTLLLQITDMETVWIGRLTEKEILRQKNKFAKNLYVSDPEELFQLFDQLLRRPDPKASYLITKKKSMELQLQVNKVIEVYPFSWSFRLENVPCQQIKAICSDVVNPLLRTVQSLQVAYEMIWKKTKILEQELIKKMTENEKNNYKSPFLDLPNPEAKTNEENYNLIQNILTDFEEFGDLDDTDNREDILVDINFKPFTTSIFQNNCVPQKYRKQRRSLSSTKKFSEKKVKKAVQKVRPVNKSVERIMRTDQQLVNQLLLQKQADQHNKKKKKVDFL